MESHTPYESGDVSDSAWREESGMRYGYAFTWVTESPQWLMNVLLTGVCQLIPVVGPIVLIGYRYEIIETRHQDRDARCPDFDFNRFVDYLVRGVWPFLVQLVVSLVLAPVVGLVTIGPFVAMMGLASGGPPNEGSMILLAVLVSLLICGTMLLVSLVLMPMSLRAGLSQEFGQAFQFAWVWDFVRRMWSEMMVTAIVFSIAMFVLALLGYLMLCFGVYFTMAYGLIALAHLQSQLYELYLARGGEPIPLKDLKR